MGLRLAFSSGFLWLRLLSWLLVLFLLKLLFVFFWFGLFSWLTIFLSHFILLGGWLGFIFALTLGFALWLGFTLWFRFGFRLGLFSLGFLLFFSLFFLFSFRFLFDLSFFINFALLIDLSLFLSFSFLLSGSLFFLLCKRQVTSKVTRGPGFIRTKRFLTCWSFVSSKIDRECSLISSFLFFGFLCLLLFGSSSNLLLSSNLGLINGLFRSNLFLTSFNFCLGFSIILSLCEIFGSGFFLRWAWFFILKYGISFSFLFVKLLLIFFGFLGFGFSFLSF